MTLAARLSDSLHERYSITREVGRGGMATVYLAHDVRHDRSVALKVLHPDLATTLGPERFLREIRLAARLQHPHILPVFDSGTADGLLWYAMPYVAGESLRARLLRDPPVAVAEALQLGREIADALDYAHAAGVVHRDVKPENILLSAGHALLADFGIARALALSGSPAGDAALTEVGLVVGTPSYMSPEQAVGDTAIDGRSDIYSLGCVVYEVLAGKAPRGGPRDRGLLVQRFMAPVTPLKDLGVAVPPSVDHAVLRALALDPRDRFARAAEFGNALEAGPASAGAGADLGRRTAERAIAILPFANLTQQPGTDYLSDGLTEELIGALAKVEGLRVPSRTSVFALKGKSQDIRELGRQLNVETVLEGSVRQAGDRLRISAQLVSVHDGYQLWSETYDRRMADILDLQDEITRTIVRTLRVRLMGDQPTRPAQPRTRTPEAYQHYLKGRYFWNQRTGESLRKAITSFERAIELDPGYALAYAGIADAYNSLGFSFDLGGGDPAVVIPLAKAAGRRALELDDRSAEVHTSLAFTNLIHDWDWATSEREFRRALELDPDYPHAHHWYSHHLVAVGRFDESLGHSRRALELEPLAMITNVHLGWHHFFAREYPAAVEQLRATLDLDPRFVHAHHYLGFVFAQQERYDEAIVELERAVALLPASLETMAELAAVYGVAGERPKAQEILDRLLGLARERYVSPFYVARIHHGLGHREEALQWLERAYDERADLVAYLNVDPRLDDLRHEPRFAALARKVAEGGGTS